MAKHKFLEVRTNYTKHPRHNPNIYFTIGEYDEKDPDMFHAVLNARGYPRKFQTEEAATKAIKTLKTSAIFNSAQPHGRAS